MATAAQRITVGGRRFVLVPERQYARLLEGEVPPGSLDAAEYARLSIGRDLRTKRREAGLSQAEVARRAGIRTETLNRLENGRANPTIGTVRSILRALGERA
jgi:DNA-binding XRE family transcriptional regulator